MLAKIGVRYPLAKTNKLKVGDLVAVVGIEINNNNAALTKCSPEAYYIKFEHTDELSRYITDFNGVVAVKSNDGLDVCMGHHAISEDHYQEIA